MNWNSDQLSEAQCQRLDELFPEINTSIRAFGSNILVQDMVVSDFKMLPNGKKVFIPKVSADMDANVQTVALVLSIGPEASMITLGDRVREGWDLRVGDMVKLPGLNGNREVKQDEVRTRFVKPGEILGVIEDPSEVLR